MDCSVETSRLMRVELLVLCASLGAGRSQDMPSAGSPKGAVRVVTISGGLGAPKFQCISLEVLPARFQCRVLMLLLATLPHTASDSADNQPVASNEEVAIHSCGICSRGSRLVPAPTLVRLGFAGLDGNALPPCSAETAHRFARLRHRH